MEISLLLLLWLSVVVALSFVVARDNDDNDNEGCSVRAFAGHSRGFLCPITEPGLRSIPPNASALRLIPSSSHSWLNLTIPSLPSLRTLEVDVTRAGALSPRPFSHLSGGLTQLQLFHSSSNAREFRFAVDAAYFEGIPGLRKLFLPDLGIEDLPLGAFGGLGGLRILELHLNHLWRIRNGTFSGCCRLLSRLTLSMNRIADMRQVSLASLSGLQSLDLSSNLLTSLPGHSFDGLPNLVNVNLERNAIHSVYPLAFAGLGSLKELTLNHNRLQVQDPTSGDVTGLRRSSFDGLTSLVTLELKANDVTRVGFLDALSLTGLDLSENRISFLPIELFQGLSNLTDLDLSGNQLTTLDPGFLAIFRRLTSLDLSLNPWTCDCRLLWLTDWLRTSDDASASQVISGLEDTKCSEEPGSGVTLALHNNNTECRDEFTSADSVQSPESVQTIIRQAHTTPDDNYGHSTDRYRINRPTATTKVTDYVTQAVMTSPSIEMTSPSIEMTSSAIEMTSPSTEMTSPSIEMTSLTAEMTSFSSKITSLSAEITFLSAEMTSSSTEMTSSPTEMTSPSSEITSFSAEITFLSAEMTSSSTEMTSSSTEMTSPSSEITSSLTITAHDGNVITQDDIQTTEFAETEKPTTTVVKTATVESVTTRNSTVLDPLLLSLLLPQTTTTNADAPLPSTSEADDSAVALPRHLQSDAAAHTIGSPSLHRIFFLFIFVFSVYESFR